MPIQTLAIMVSVIIITRNRPKLLEDYLKRVTAQSYSPFEVIVVDSSPKSRSEQPASKCGKVKFCFLSNGRNRMTASRNLGIQTASGQILVFLDDDSMVADDWLAQLISSYNDPRVGGVGGRVVEEGDPLSPPGSLKIGRVYADGRHSDNFFQDLAQTRKVDRLKGCNMSFRKGVFEDVGLFDSTYDEVAHSPFEEVDFCTRVRRAGYKLLFNPRAVVHHLNAPRDDGLPRSLSHPEVLFAYERNRTYFSLKNYGWFGWNVLSLFAFDPLLGLLRLLVKPSPDEFRCMRASLKGKYQGALAARTKGSGKRINKD